MPLRSLTILPLLACGAVACSGEPQTLGMGQPLRVEDAQFRAGELPGQPPLTAQDVIDGILPTSPNVGSISSNSGVIRQGESRTFAGLASDESSAIAVKFEGAGSGYWLVPTRNRDALSPGEVEWRLRASFANDLEPGPHRLLFAAIDPGGRSGTQGALRLCVSPAIPDNGNSCDETISPPALVVSLGWDTPVDLDLRVITPSGKVVDSKRPSTAIEDDDGDFDPTEPGTGILQRDGVANCRDEGDRRENLVFQSAPAPGTYLIYANLYDACGHDTVHFDVALQVAEPGTAPDTFAARRTYFQPGQLLAVQANGGAKLGSFVTSFVAR